MTDQPVPHLDALIVGAGLSGIGMAWHIANRCRGKRYLLLEARDRLGGTWDFFRYPGIRSDSDMFTLGYRFRPWKEAKAIADGPAILRYVNETAQEAGITPHIRFNHKVTAADWDTQSNRWTITAETPAGTRRFTASFLLMCAGYYSYEEPYDPPLPGEDRFAGTRFHAQHWPQGLDHAGKRVIVIGSGATAVTIVPELAKTAAHVIMLQRSPTWMVSRPSEDRVANLVRRVLPSGLAYFLIRWRNIGLQRWFFDLARRRPEFVGKRLLEMLTADLPEELIAAHFTPRYKVWDQRVCLVPDGDLFAAVREGRAEVVTDTIAEVTESGITTASGRHLEADILVKATGLNLRLLGGTAVSIDGVAQHLPSRFTYKAMMFDGIPNLVSVFGYTNASWTLKADLTAEFACRLLHALDRKGAAVAVAENRDPSLTHEPWLDFTSGYVQRSLAILPKRGSKYPWKVHQNYLKDLRLIRHAPLEDGVLGFHSRWRPAQAAAATPAAGSSTAPASVEGGKVPA
ncbi:flavin-containing monooxygenase [Thermaurantiacus sp.]